MRIYLSVRVVHVLLVVAIVLSMPMLAFAEPDPKCKGCDPEGRGGKPLCSTITCGVSGMVGGHCVADGICRAETAETPGGGSMNVSPASLLGLVNSIAQLMNALRGGQPPAGGGAGGTGTGVGGAGQGCMQYYQVSTPSSDPCAYYVPPVSDSINTGSGIGTGTGTGDGGGNNSTGGGGIGNVSDLINTLLGGGGATSSGAGAIPTGLGKGTGGVSSSTATGTTGISPGGVSGEIRVLPNGATIVITNQQNQKNTVVAGFLGTQASGGAQPQGVIANWCRTRPWATNFLSFIIPPTFFDNLCGLRGYQVGGPPQPPGQAQIGSQVTLTQTKVTNPPTSTGTVPVQAVPKSPPMQVDIWAVPAAVPLGARTTIFWTSKNAASCVETSPDGSFSHNTLSGGGATVPLSGPTTFTISCTAPDGTHATDFVTVKLTI